MANTVGYHGLCNYWPRYLEVFTAQRAADRALVSPVSCVCRLCGLDVPRYNSISHGAEANWAVRQHTWLECDYSNPGFLESPRPRKWLLSGGDSVLEHGGTQKARSLPAGSRSPCGSRGNTKKSQKFLVSWGAMESAQTEIVWPEDIGTVLALEADHTGFKFYLRCFLTYNPRQATALWASFLFGKMEMIQELSHGFVGRMKWGRLPKRGSTTGHTIPAWFQGVS